MLCCRSWTRLRDNLEAMTSVRPSIRTEVQVMFFDTDCGGVVSNIAYLRFIEIARTLLAEELGLRLVEMATSQKYPVVVRTEIDYRRAAKLADRLVIEGWLDKLDRARFWCAFRIVRPHDHALIAECRQMLALIEMPSGKLLRLPESWEKYRAIGSSVSLTAAHIEQNV
jgi:YbgC/YbaW family acyl-CoA thioester hydrolase